MTLPISPLLGHLLTCLPQRPRAEVAALASALEERGVTLETLPRGAANPALHSLPRPQRSALLSAGEIGPCVDLRWREALEAEGGPGLLRLVVLVAGIRSAGELAEWPPERLARVRWIGRGERISQTRRAAERCGVSWGDGPILPVVSPTWRDALQIAGGAAFARRVLAAGLDSPEALARLTTADAYRLPGLGRARLLALRRAALSVGLAWGADLERHPGRPSISGRGESPRLSVSVSPETAARVEEKARTAGISVSEWLRGVVEGALGPP